MSENVKIVGKFPFVRQRTQICPRYMTKFLKVEKFVFSIRSDRIDVVMNILHSESKI